MKDDRGLHFWSCTIALIGKMRYLFISDDYDNSYSGYNDHFTNNIHARLLIQNVSKQPMQYSDNSTVVQCVRYKIPVTNDIVQFIEVNILALLLLL